MVSKALNESGGVEAESLRIAEQYIGAFGQIAKEGTTLLLPASISNPVSKMAQAMSIYNNLIHNKTIDGAQELGPADSGKSKLKSSEGGDHFGEPVFSFKVLRRMITKVSHHH